MYPPTLLTWAWLLLSTTHALPVNRFPNDSSRSTSAQFDDDLGMLFQRGPGGDNAGQQPGYSTPPMPTPLTFVTESITPPPPRPPQPSPVNRLGMSKFRSNVFRPYQPGPTSTSPPVPSAQSKGGNFPVSETQRPPANRPSMIGSPTSLSNYHSSDGHKRQDQPPYATSPPNLSAQASNSKSRISSRDKQLDTLYLSSSKETYSNLQGQLEIVPQTQRRTAHGR